MEAQNSFGEAFLQRKGSVPRAGFELTTDGDISRNIVRLNSPDFPFF
jgi:hypothetical protein